MDFFQMCRLFKYDNYIMLEILELDVWCLIVVCDCILMFIFYFYIASCYMCKYYFASVHKLHITILQQLLRSILCTLKCLEHLKDLNIKTVWVKAHFIEVDFVFIIFQVVYCMDRCLEIAPGCSRFKVLKAECLALLKRYEESQIIAK